MQALNSINNLIVKNKKEQLMKLYFDKNIQRTSFDLRPELPLKVYFDVFERPLNTSEPLINPHLKTMYQKIHQSPPAPPVARNSPQYSYLLI